MKLLLSSAGLTNQELSQKFLQMAGTDKPRVAFIATAARFDTDQDWVEQDRRAIRETGASLIDLELDRLSSLESKSLCEQSDVIWFNGGNTYYARYWIEKSGLAHSLEYLLESRLYVGSSAGSMIVGDHQNATDKYFPGEREEYLKWGPRNAISIDTGINIVPFAILPHYASTKPYFSQLHNLKRLKSDLSRVNYPLYAISDGRAIVYEDGVISLIGDGPWEKFGPAY